MIIVCNGSNCKLESLKKSLHSDNLRKNSDSTSIFVKSVEFLLCPPFL